MRRPGQGNQLLARHVGRAGEQEEKPLPARFVSRPAYGNRLLGQHLSRAGEQEGKPPLTRFALVKPDAKIRMLNFS